MLDKASKKMIEAGYSVFKPKGKYLFAAASASENPDVTHIGQMRVSFEFNRCFEATIIAQQVHTKSRPHTFRAWDPENLMVPAGEEENIEPQLEETNSQCDSLCCFSRLLPSKNFSRKIDFVSDQIINASDYFDEQETSQYRHTHLMRFVGLALAFAAAFLLLTPTLGMTKWIPFVRFLLMKTGSLAVLTASAMVSMALWLVVTSLAWLCLRPLTTCALLSITFLSLLYLAKYEGASFAPIST